MIDPGQQPSISHAVDSKADGTQVSGPQQSERDAERAPGTAPGVLPDPKPEEETPCLSAQFVIKTEPRHESKEAVGVSSQDEKIAMEESSIDQALESAFLSSHGGYVHRPCPGSTKNTPTTHAFPPNAGPLAPGMTATPGYQNARYQNAMLHKEEHKASMLHTEEHQPAQNAGLMAPGMTATPGYQNAGGTTQVQYMQHVGAPMTYQLSHANASPPAPCLTGQLPPGIAATPGHHNAAMNQDLRKLPQPMLTTQSLPQEGQPARESNAAFSSAKTESPHAASNSDVDPTPPGMTATPGYQNAGLIEPTIHHAFPSCEVHVPTNGGVIGFETKAGKKRSLMQATSAQQATKEWEPATKKSKPTCGKDNTKLVHGPDNCVNTIGADDKQNPEAAKHESDQLIEQTNTEQASTSVSSIAGSEAKRHIRTWVGTSDTLSPLMLKCPIGTTSGMITQAEAKLGSMDQPIAPRSWVGTHLPLHEPLTDKQVVILHPRLPSDHKCPMITGENSQPEIPLPCQRLLALWKQASWVAEDEMDFYMTAAKQFAQVSILPPQTFFNDTAVKIEASVWLQQPVEWVTPDRPWITAAIVSRHWVPIIIRKQGSTIQVATTPEGSPFLEAIQDITAANGLTMTATQKMLPQSFHGDCGFQAFAWIMASLAEEKIEPLAPLSAEKWRHLFAEHLIATSKHDEVVIELHIGGAKVDLPLQRQLMELLAAHGVWHDRLADRATKIMDGVAAHVLRNALGAKRPWAELKQAANSAQPMIKLIQQDELNAQIAARADHKRAYGTKLPSKHSKKQTPTNDLPNLRASDLQVPQGVFKQQDGHILGPLGINDVGSSCQGVVLVDQGESEALFRLQSPVTPHGLAVIVLATKTNANLHTIEPIRFPALCLVTQEPLIASGYLYQMGAQPAVRFEPSVKLAVEEHDTKTIRCLVFQDQAGQLWQDIQKQPVKGIFTQEPILAPKGQGEQSIVIDVWDRQWLSKRFEKLKPAVAEIFVFSFRMMAKHADELINKSGQQGIYYEPRTHCGRYPCPDHHVTWLSKMSYQDAQFAQQTSPFATTLTRHGDRFGLRSDTYNAQAIHDKHRPDTPMLMGQKKALYTMGPMPFAATKESISKLLKTWGWDARALQPRGRAADSSGITWTIQAVEDPSHWIYTLQHGDVLITRLRERSPVKAAPVNIVASRKTIEHLQQNEDPWLKHDPWNGSAASQPTKQTSSTTTTPSQAQIATIEANVEKRVIAAIQAKQHDGDVSMEADHMESRVAQLEKQIQQVHAHQVGMDSKINTMQNQLEAQGQQFNASLDMKLAAQMEKIEALFSKRGRHE